MHFNSDDETTNDLKVIIDDNNSIYLLGRGPMGRLGLYFYRVEGTIIIVFGAKDLFWIFSYTIGASTS